MGSWSNAKYQHLTADQRSRIRRELTPYHCVDCAPASTCHQLMRKYGIKRSTLRAVDDSVMRRRG